MNTEAKEQIDIAYNEKVLEGPIKEGLLLRRGPYPDIILTTQHLNELRRRLYELFCNWVLDETVYEENSWSWSEVIAQEASQEVLLEKYTNISEWMDKELSGSKSHSNFAKSFIHEVEEICYSVALEIFVEGVPPDEEEEWRYSTLLDSSVSFLEEALLTFCRHISTAEAWDFGKEFTQENRKIELTRREAAQQEYKKAREAAERTVDTFIQLNCPNLRGLELTFKDKSWVSTLKEAIDCATDQELDALKLIGYQLKLSKKARNLMQEFLCGKIKDRKQKVLAK